MKNQKHGDLLGEGICPVTEEPRTIRLYDYSFTHAFGTEHDFIPVCECHEEPVETYIPNSPEATS